MFFSFSFAVPPSKPTIFDETGREVKDLVGPYLEGETIVLKCITSGGKSLSLSLRLHSRFEFEFLNFDTKVQLFLSLVLLLISNLINELRLHQSLQTCSPPHF